MTHPSRVACEMRRTLSATLQAAEEFCADFRGRGRPLLNRENYFAAELLVREALTNAVVHGCQADPGKQVRCCLRLGGRRLLVAVGDDGEGFDWRTAWSGGATIPNCSGRGIQILRKYASRVRYNVRGNRVTIIKHFAEGKTMTVVSREDNKAVVRPAGDSVVASTIPELRSKMRGMVEEGVRDLVVDFTGVQMVDSSGIGLLISAYNSLRKVGGRLEVIHVSADILELFRTMRMHQHFSVSGN